MKKLYLFLALLSQVFCAYADNPCVKYKTEVTSNVYIDDYKIEIYQPDYSFKYSHGNVQSGIAYHYKLGTQITDILSGYCISINSVNMNIKFEDFIINIDKKYEADSCAYNLVLEHENKHVDATVKTYEKYKDKMQKKLEEIGSKTDPIFVENRAEIAIAQDKLQSTIFENTEITKITDEVNNEIKKLNQDIDSVDDNSKIRDCYKRNK